MIEVVVALAVVTIVIAAIASLVASLANGTRTLEQHVALIETARLVATSLPRGANLPDDLAGEMSGHRWQVRVLPFDDAGPVIPTSPWIPQTVLIRVRSPSGAMLAIETVRLQRRAGQ
jgi:general secretion pathway protein I